MCSHDQQAFSTYELIQHYSIISVITNVRIIHNDHDNDTSYDNDICASAMVFTNNTMADVVRVS